MLLQITLLGESDEILISKSIKPFPSTRQFKLKNVTLAQRNLRQDYFESLYERLIIKINDKFNHWCI